MHDDSERNLLFDTGHQVTSFYRSLSDDWFRRMCVFINTHVVFRQHAGERVSLTNSRKLFVSNDFHDLKLFLPSLWHQTCYEVP
ncbi:MAG: hypothetical protein ISQ09_08665 [Rubripirellula sp.]|jgi:hypothetical protein|nr:hypothetical protein [Rubripirellula sp.]MDA9778288.1 hypothetical protein [Rubripirellula sp.]